MEEFELLRQIFEANRRLDGRVLIPPGDDMGMVRLGGNHVLAAVDQVIDGVHFRLADTSIQLVGRKAVTRSLSDVAAMAAHPVGALAAVTLPLGFTTERAAALFEAVRSTCETYECPLIGGDMAFHRDPTGRLMCAITVLAEQGNRPAVRRDGAKAGDTIYVTGSLGGSLQPDGGGRHLTFEPRIREAIALAQELGDRLHSMIDISDGLGRDASHVAEQSGVCMTVDARRIPCTQGATWKAALSDGEDYELCFTATGNVPRHLPGGLQVTAVGTVHPPSSDPTEPRVLVEHGGTILRGDELGWQHRV